MTHAARATAQGARPWPADDELVRLFAERGSMTAVAQACGKARTSLRDYLRLRPELRARTSGNPTGEDELAKYREARRLRMAGLRQAEEWIRVLAGDPCCYCGAETEVSDHVHPLARGGDYTWENLTGACLSCNSSKGTRSLLVFMLERLDAPLVRPVQQ